MFKDTLHDQEKIPQIKIIIFFFIAIKNQYKFQSKNQLSF